MNNEQKLFFSLAYVLLSVGLMMVHSASITSLVTDVDRVYLARHIVFLCFGLVVAGVCTALPPRYWYHLAPWIFAGTVALLVAVLIPGVGVRVNGAQRWLRFGPLSAQPSELAKVTLPMLMARILARRRGQLRHWVWGTLPPVLPAVCVVPLVFLQPDLGTAAFLVCIAVLTLYLGGWPIRNFLVLGLLGAPCAGAVLALKPYQLQRISGFLAAWKDFHLAPYQIKQSLLTLGAGGLSGVGLGRGWQKLRFLPEANTDFVFAVIGEELGLIGTVGLILVWLALYLVGLRLLRRLPPGSFAFISGATLLSQLVFQAALNVAVVTALVPPKGIPHPLISYGGSSLVTSLATIGIIVGLSRAQPGRDDVVIR